MATRPTCEELEQRVNKLEIRCARLKSAEEALRVERDFAESLLNTAQAIVLVLGTRGRIIRFNRYMEEISGYSLAEVRDKDWFSTFLPERDHARLRELFKKAAGDIQTRGNVNPIITKDGQERQIEWYDKTLKDADGKVVGLLAIGQDITERKRAEEALRKSEERYRSLVENIDLGVTLIDSAHKIIMTNGAQGRMFGKPVAEFVGKECFREFEKREAICPHCPGVQAMSTGQPAEVKTQGIRDDGTSVDVRIQAFPTLGQDGTATGFIEVVEDITEKKKLEAQLRQAQKMEAIGTLSGGIAHDFNNILGIIMGNTELALEDVPQWNPAYSSLQESQKACLRAKDLVKQILTYARQTEHKKKPTEIAPIVKETLKLLRSSIPTSIDIQEDIAAETSIVMADAVQVHQVLMNLCTNAAQAMEEMGSVLQVALTDVELDEDAIGQFPDLKPGPYVRLSVRDTGCGIKPEIIDQIFDPYFTTKGVGEGTGLGLAVVQGIVESHGGGVSAYSEPGKGTTFHVLFPRVEHPVEAKPEAIKSVPTGNERILFVDDEESLARLGKQMLERLGYEVKSRTSPLETLEDFRDHPDKFDLVITDMTMPETMGDTLAKQLMEIRPDIPVILCTGFSNRIDEDKASTMGIKGFIMKPLAKRKLAKTVRRVLDNR